MLRLGTGALAFPFVSSLTRKRYRQLDRCRLRVNEVKMANEGRVVNGLL